MNDPLTTLKESANEVRLSRAAYERMRAELVAHMSAHPIARVPSPYLQYLRKPVAAVLAFSILIAFGGATAYASEGALPGDALYPIKVKLVEPARGLFAVTPEAKAAWHADIAITRLNEAEKLAERAAFSHDDSAQSEERIIQSLMAAEHSINELSKEKPEAATKLKASFTASLTEHEKALGAFEATTSKDGEEAKQLAHRLKEEIHAVFTEQGNATSTPPQKNDGGSGDTGDQRSGRGGKND